MFKINIENCENKIIDFYEDISVIPYYELIKVEVVIKIYINDILFFSDDYFPVLEFIYQFEHWKNSSFEQVFEYNTIESETNPIISFRLKDEYCVFDSVWKLTDKPLSVKLTEVVTEMNDCKKSLCRI